MKTFEIIEEGRLSKSEMGALLGGSLYCSKIYTVLTCTINKVIGSNASCPGIYTSCGDNGVNHQTCAKILGYNGKPFGGGDVVPLPPGSYTCPGATATIGYSGFEGGVITTEYDVVQIAP